MITYVRGDNGLPIVKEWCPNCWINIEVPTETDIEYLLDTLKVPEEFIVDIEDADERPRVEVEDGWQLIVVRIPIHNPVGLPYTTVPLGILIKDNIMVTLCYHKTEMLDGHLAYNRRKGIGFTNHYDFVLKLLLSSSVWFLKYLKQLNICTKETEEELSKSIRNKELYKLLEAEKCYVYFITALRGNDILMHRLKSNRNYKEKLDHELIEDVEIELKQALETANTHSDILSGMMDAYASVISNNMSVVIKELTLVSIVIMIPTLVASFFGMNLANGMEASNHGFLTAVVISVLLSVIGVVWFKFRKWM